MRSPIKLGTVLSCWCDRYEKIWLVEIKGPSMTTVFQGKFIFQRWGVVTCPSLEGGQIEQQTDQVACPFPRGGKGRDVGWEWRNLPVSTRSGSQSIWSLLEWRKISEILLTAAMYVSILCGLCYWEQRHHCVRCLSLFDNRETRGLIPLCVHLHNLHDHLFLIPALLSVFCFCDRE
jgi:hypothetical protein